MQRSSADGRIVTATPHLGPSTDSPDVPVRTPGTGRRSLRTASVGLAAATVLTQISNPLLSGEPLRTATIAAVLLFTAASLADAAARFGPGVAARVLVVAGGLGLAAEAVGVGTGFPFGRYTYHDSLGPALLGVPLVVPLAWTMMAYPCLLLGRRLARVVRGLGRPVVVVAAGAATLAAWDLYLDPQMVAAGHWTWLHPTPALPGVPGIPLTNYAGWLLVATLLIVALDRAVPRPPVVEHGVDQHGADRHGIDEHDMDEAAPALLLGWTWLGSALGNLAFFGRPAVAAYGVLAMGMTTGPYLRAVLRSARLARHGQPDRHGQR